MQSVKTEVRIDNTDLQKQLSKDMSFIRCSLNSLNENVQKNKENISAMSQKLKVTEEQVQNLERKVDQLLSNSRRKNVKINGLRGERSDTGDSLIDTVVHKFNHYLGADTLRQDDVDEAYCVGRPSDSHPRPVIVSFRWFGHTMMVMKNKDGRNDMKKDGIRMGLTTLWNNGTS